MAVCPHGCIDLGRDRASDPVITVAPGCTECGRCVRVCPGLRNDWRPVEAAAPGEGTTAIARALPPALRGRQVASGGAVTALAAAFLAEHPAGLVMWTSLEPGAGLRPRTELLDAEGFARVQGDSIYTPSFANRVFRHVPPARSVLAIGLPCQMYGLRLLMAERPELAARVTLRIALFCGLTVQESGIHALIRAQGGDPATLARIRFRGDGGVKAVLGDGRALRLDKNSVNFSHLCARCALCPDQTGVAADIGCGDAWLERFTRDSQQRWSLLVVRSAAGDRLLARAVRGGALWAMRTGDLELRQAQGPMLFFKRETLGQRLALNRLLGGYNPDSGGRATRRSCSPRFFLGNLLLLLHLRLRRLAPYRRLLDSALFRRALDSTLRITLYTDLAQWRRRVTAGGLARRIDRVLPLRRLARGWARLVRFAVRRGGPWPRLRLAGPEPAETLADWPESFPEVVATLRRRGEMTLNGRVEVFGRVYDLARGGWHGHPATGRIYPRLPAFLAGEYADYRRYGDLKDTFELHKHIPLVELALLWRIEGGEEKLVSLLDALRSWRREFPPAIGVGWLGNVHVAQRMVSWWWIGYLLRSEPGGLPGRIGREIARGLEEHAAVLGRRYRFPANNHLLGSLCALVISGWHGRGRRGERRSARYLDELAACVQRLVAPDGAPCEGSLAYGRLVFEFLLLLHVVAGIQARELPAVVSVRARAMVRWFLQMIGPEDHLPDLGDASGEHAFPFADSLMTEADCLALAKRVLLGQCGGEVTPLERLLAGWGEKGTRGVEEPLPPAATFLDAGGGYGRASRSNEHGRWTVWLRGRGFGLAPDFAHAHADLLAPILWWDGEPVLTEAGVFRYNVDSEERMADVLSQGHSGVRYDLREPAIWRGTFAWGGEPVSADLRALPAGLAGRVRYPDGAVLERRVSIGDRGIEIADEFTPGADDAKLLEFCFIVPGRVSRRGGAVAGVFLAELAGTARRLEIGFDHQTSGGPGRISPVRIADGYGRASQGWRIVFPVLTAGAGIWRSRWTPC